MLRLTALLILAAAALCVPCPPCFALRADTFSACYHCTAQLPLPTSTRVHHAAHEGSYAPACCHTQLEITHFSQPPAFLIALQTWRSPGGLTLKDRTRLQALPKGFIRDTARGALTWWNAVEPSKQPVYIVTGISLAVWGLWNVPRLTGFMVRNFVQALPPAAGSRRVLPMLLVSIAAQS